MGSLLSFVKTFLFTLSVVERVLSFGKEPKTSSFLTAKTGPPRRLQMTGADAPTNLR